MTGWTLFFVLVGVAYAATWPFKIEDAIERPRKIRQGGKS